MLTCFILRILLLCCLGFIQFAFSYKLYGQRELVPLPLDKLNNDSLHEVIQQKEKEKDYKALGVIYGGIYNYYLYSSFKDSVIIYTHKAEENAYKAGDSSIYYFIQLQRAEFYTNALDFKAAKGHYEKALQYYLRTKNYTFQGSALGGLSYMYELQKDTFNMIKYLELFEASNKWSLDTSYIVSANHTRILIMINENKLDSAITLLKKNLWLINHAKKYGNGEHIRSFWREIELGLLAQSYYQKNNYGLAIRYLKEAQQFNKQLSDFNDQTIFRYRVLVNSYINNNQKDSAIKYVNTFFEQTKKALTNINPERINEITARYEAEKKQSQIEELERKNYLHQLTVSSQRKLNIAFASIFFIIVASAFFIIKNIRQKRKIALELSKQEMLYNEQLHVKKELEIRDRISRDLHDDVGGTLSSVKAYSEILEDNPNNPFIAELIKINSTEMLERLEVISWATNPQHDNLKSLKNMMIKFAAPLCHSTNIQFNIQSDGMDEEMLMSGEVRQNIFLVFKEAVNNMIKYADATECNTQLFIRNNHFVLQIADNGKGFEGTIKGTGNGCKNMQKEPKT